MSEQSKMTAALQYDSSRFPTVIVNDGSIETLAQAKLWLSDNLAAVKKELGCTGAILFRGFPVVDAQSYDDFFAAFDYAAFTYKESLSNAVRINYTERVFTANEAPKAVEIYLHNEMAQTPVYPAIISLFCQQAADAGGATVLCRTDQIYQAILAAEPEATKKLAQTGVKYTTCMPNENSPGSGQGRSWRSTLSVETVEQAEVKLHSLGYRWKWLADGSLEAQTAALPAIKTLDNGQSVFFNQTIAAYMGWQGVKENPASALCFGDDSAIDKAYLDRVSEIAQSLTYDLDWQDGDVAIVDNHLAMHGRRPYSGDRQRKVLVALGK